MKRPDHPRAEQGYAYVDAADIIGGRVMNADHDAIYIVQDGRTFVITLNGQDNPFIEYGKKT